MVRYIIVRTIWVFIVLLAFLSIFFTTIRLVPEHAEPLREEEIINYYNKQVTDGFMTTEIIRDPQEVRDIRNRVTERCKGCYYHDEGDQYRVFVPVPIATQYFRYVRNVLTDFNWGVSTKYQANVDVFDILRDRLPVTMKINFIALIFYVPIGFALGIFAALRKDKLSDNLISLGVMIFISVPGFVIMILLVLIFGYQLGWLPTAFPSSDVRGSIVYTSLVLPVLGLSLASIAALTRTTRAELTEVLTSEFLLLARTKGLTRRQAVIRHAMRNSMVPLVPSIIFAFVGLLSGSVIIERIYSVPGMGRVFVRALQEFDYNLIMALSAFYTFISLFAVLVVDLTYGLVDPRIRMGARK